MRIRKFKSAMYWALLPLPNQTRLAWLRKQTSDEPQPYEGQILRYLEAAPCLWGTGLFADHLDHGRDVTSFAAFSDGEWVWSNLLSHYVRHYHFRVPLEFVTHMRARGWAPPPQAEGRAILEHWRAMNDAVDERSPDREVPAA